ncbi:MAG: hypothetical protein ACR2PS_08735 [Pseudomonadales bacterium]
MIDRETTVDNRLTRQALLGTIVGTLLGGAYMAFADKGWIYVVAVFLGTACALIPIWRAANKSPPQRMADVLLLSRISTKSFVIWLIMMSVYLLMLMPMGPEIFRLGVATCIVGLLASRLVFPAYVACLREAFGPPQSLRDPEPP